MMIRLIPLMVLLCGGVAQASPGHDRHDCDRLGDHDWRDHRGGDFDQDGDRDFRDLQAKKANKLRFHTNFDGNRQRVMRVRWGSAWYPAQIVYRSGSHFYIRYLGWSSRWNEWVRRDRIRF